MIRNQNFTTPAQSQYEDARELMDAQVKNAICAIALQAEVDYQNVTPRKRVRVGAKA